jgi:glycosyltransferase involved in cell wall biosynthesis
VLQTGESLPLAKEARKLRTALLCEELAGRGHEVTWWAGAFDHFRKKMVFDRDTTARWRDNVSIVALKGIGYKENISLRRYFDHRLMAVKFRERIRKEPVPDAIVAAIPCHLMAYEAAKYAGEYGVPFFVDIRDPWPDIFLDRVPGPLKGIARLLLQGDFRASREAIRRADAIVSMMDVLMDWGLRCAGRERTDSDRVFLLGSEKPVDIPHPSPSMGRILEKVRGRFVVAFVGTMANYHNPSVIAEGARIAKGEKGIVFVLAGDGDLSEEVRRRASGLDNVLFTGWLENNDILALLANSHVGVCPTPFVADFFPNKAFLYLSMGLPVLSAFEGDLKGILEKERIGFHFPPNDAEAFAGSVLRLYRDAALYEEVAGNVKRVFSGRFDSGVIYREYADLVERVCRDRKDVLAAASRGKR